MVDGQTLPFVSLFTGAGGLDIGLEAAGFETRLCVELDEDARRTLQANRPHWPLSKPGDIHELGAAGVVEQSGLRKGDAALLAGGPPCQPFSKAAFWHSGETSRLRDPRADTLQAYVGIVEGLLPEVILLENVKGIDYSQKDEAITRFKSALQRVNKRAGTNYQPDVFHLNAADFGVPQVRERVFILAHRDGKRFSAPTRTHGPGTGTLYVTAWDALRDVVPPSSEQLSLTSKWADLLPTIPEGSNYLWHTPKGGGLPLFGWRTRYWSFLLKLAKNRPSWTIQALPGPATGPFHWNNRLLSVRELCRLQTFPDDYEITGARSSAQRQIGNAVPCLLGEVLGAEIRRQFFGDTSSATPTLALKSAADCPPPERIRRVPKRYQQLIAKHENHPGTGMGPRARLRTHGT